MVEFDQEEEQMANHYCWYCSRGTKKGGSHVYCLHFDEWVDKWHGEDCRNFESEYEEHDPSDWQCPKCGTWNSGRDRDCQNRDCRSHK